MEEITAQGVYIVNARQFFNLGMYSGWEMYRNPMGEGWVLVLVTKLEKRRMVLIPQRSEQPKVFRTVEAALRAVESIGFQVDGFRSS